MAVRDAEEPAAEKLRCRPCETGAGCLRLCLWPAGLATFSRERLWGAARSRCRPTARPGASQELVWAGVAA